MSDARQTSLDRALTLLEQANRLAVDQPVKLGILTPLTGPGDATAGELVVRGACIGAEYVREHGGVLGGRQIELVVQNDQASAAEEGMPRSAVGGMAKLAIVDEVIAAFGQWHLRTTPWAAETAERLGVPIFIENGHTTVTAQRRRTVFRTYYTAAERASLMTGFLVARGMRRVAILAADTVFGLMAADALEECGWAAGIDFLRFDFPQETTDDVRDELRKIKDYAPDMIFNAGVIRTNYMIMDQAAELGLRPAVPMMVSFSFPLRSADFWRLAGDNGNGIIWPATHYRPSYPGLTDIGRWFTDRYRERFGDFPPDTSLSAFTDVTIIAQALAISGTDSREDLISALESGTFDTWRGPLSFDRGEEHWHHTAAPIWLLQYQRPQQSFDQAAVIFPPDISDAEYLSPEQLVRAVQE